MAASTTKATAADWRAQVDKELARTPGASFDKTLVHTTPEGIAVQPLYTEAVAGAAGLVKRGPGLTTARIVARLPPDATEAEVAAEVAGGVDGVWLSGGGTALTALRAIGQAERPFLVLDVQPSALEYTSWLSRRRALAVNAIGRAVRLQGSRRARASPPSSRPCRITRPAVTRPTSWGSPGRSGAPT